MPEPDPGTPSRAGTPGAHRAPTTPSSLVRNLAGPVLAVAVVAAVIGLLIYLNGRPTSKGTPAVLSSSGGARTSSALTRPPSATAAPSPSRPAATSATAAPTTSSTTSAATSPGTAVAHAPVTVLNNSRIDGLATRVAAQVRSAGWPVAGVGNFTGRIAATTAYFAPGQEAAARALAARFPKIERVLPRFAGLPGSGLTLVVTRDWVS